MLRQACLCRKQWHLAEQHIFGLPFDVVVRRLQSSSLTNRVRSLEAHFALASSNDNAEAQEATSSRMTASAFSNDGLRDILSVKLLHEFQEDNRKHHLGLTIDDISVVLSNAIRHRLRRDLIQYAMNEFVPAVTEKHHPRSSGLPANTVADAAFLRQGLALTRVMEACVDISEVYPERPLLGLSLEELASFASAVEQYWTYFSSDTSTACLWVQFFALLLDPMPSSLATEELNAPSPSSSTPVSSSPMASSRGLMWDLGALHTDPNLFRERCYKMCEKATTQVLLVPDKDGCAAGGNVYQPTELVRLADAVQRVRRYERVTLAPPSGRGLKLPHLWSFSSTKRREIQQEPLLLYRQLGAYVSACVVGTRRVGPSPGANAEERDGHPLPYAARTRGLPLTRMSLPQMVSVFLLACHTTSTETIARFSVPMCDVLHRLIAVTAVKDMESLLLLGEACVVTVDGTQTILAEVLRCLQRSSPVLLKPPDDAHGAGYGSFWRRACELLGNASLAVRSVAESTSLTLARTLLQHQEYLQLAGRPTSTEETNATPACSEYLCNVRYGALVLAGQLLQYRGGYLNTRFEALLCDLVESQSFVPEGRRGLSGLVRALNVFAIVATRHVASDSSHSSFRATRTLRTLSCLLTQLSDALRDPGEGASASTSNMRWLTATEKMMLRTAVRGVRELATRSVGVRADLPVPPTPLPTLGVERSQMLSNGYSAEPVQEEAPSASISLFTQHEPDTTPHAEALAERALFVEGSTMAGDALQLELQQLTARLQYCFASQ